MGHHSKNKFSCLFVEPLNQLNQLLASVILELVFVGEDGLEDGQELGCKLANGGVFPFVCSVLDVVLHFNKNLKGYHEGNVQS
jgi:hypothetical protein